MAKGNRLTKIKFLSMNRDIKAAVAANAYRSADIAAKHGVSTETVRQVKNAKTWPGFVTAKQHKASRAASIKADKFERAQKAGLKPVTAVARKEQRAGDEITAAIGSPFITRKELREEIRAVHSRVDVLSDVLRGLNRDPLFRALFGRKVRGIIAQRDESKEAA